MNLKFFNGCGIGLAFYFGKHSKFPCPQLQTILLTVLQLIILTAVLGPINAVSAQSLEKVQIELRQKYSNQPDSIKAKAIFDFVAENVKYDFKLLNGQINMERYKTLQDPEVVLKRGLAVCEGYSNLFRNLCQSLELPAYQATGFVGNEFIPKGTGFQNRHAWNLARIDGEWYLFDPTWGSGYRDARTGEYVVKKDYTYFMAEPSSLSKSHYPLDPLFQLTSSKIDLTSFLKDSFDENGLNFSRTNSELDDFSRLTSEEQELKSYERRIAFDPKDYEAIFQLSYLLQHQADQQIDSLVEALQNAGKKDVLDDQLKLRYQMLIKEYQKSINLLEDLRGKKFEQSQLVRTNLQAAKTNMSNIQRLYTFYFQN